MYNRVNVFFLLLWKSRQRFECIWTFPFFCQRLDYSILHRVCCILLILSQNKQQQKKTQHKRQMHALVQHNFQMCNKLQCFFCCSWISRANVNEFTSWKHVEMCARESWKRFFSRSLFCESFFLWFQFSIFHVVCWWSTAADYPIVGFRRRQSIYCDLFCSVVHNSSSLSLLLIKFKVFNSFWKPFLISLHASLQLTSSAAKVNFYFFQNFSVSFSFVEWLVDVE